MLRNFEWSNNISGFRGGRACIPKEYPEDGAQTLTYCKAWREESITGRVLPSRRLLGHSA